MTVVIADTSPLNYLALIGNIDLLPALYGQQIVPSAVLSELSDPAAPPEVLSFARIPPPWLIVRHLQTAHEDVTLLHLDPGERAAIQLADRETDVLLLIDEAAGRSGIPNTGTLGILRAAAIRRIVNLPAVLRRLAGTNSEFRSVSLQNCSTKIANVGEISRPYSKL
jgi:predicted nucleic acid-binding protein